VKSDVISRIRRGVYEWTELGWKSDDEIISRLLPDAILCMETMLYHYGYTDKTPDAAQSALDRLKNKARAAVKSVQLKEAPGMPHSHL
jgi:hypothetical protein